MIIMIIVIIARIIVLTSNFQPTSNQKNLLTISCFSRTTELKGHMKKIIN